MQELILIRTDLWHLAIEDRVEIFSASDYTASHSAFRSIGRLHLSGLGVPQLNSLLHLIFRHTTSLSISVRRPDFVGDLTNEPIRADPLIRKRLLRPKDEPSHHVNVTIGTGPTQSSYETGEAVALWTSRVLAQTRRLTVFQIDVTPYSVMLEQILSQIPPCVEELSVSFRLDALARCWLEKAAEALPSVLDRQERDSGKVSLRRMSIIMDKWNRLDEVIMKDLKEGIAVLKLDKLLGARGVELEYVYLNSSPLTN